MTKYGLWENKCAVRKFGSPVSRHKESCGVIISAVILWPRAVNRYGKNSQVSRFYTAEQRILTRIITCRVSHNDSLCFVIPYHTSPKFCFWVAAWKPFRPPPGPITAIKVRVSFPKMYCFLHTSSRLPYVTLGVKNPDGEKDLRLFCTDGQLSTAVLPNRSRSPTCTLARISCFAGSPSWFNGPIAHTI